MQPVADPLSRAVDVVQRDQRTRRSHDGIVRVLVAAALAAAGEHDRQQREDEEE